MHESLQRKVFKETPCSCPFTRKRPSYLISQTGNRVVTTARVRRRPGQAQHMLAVQTVWGPERQAALIHSHLELSTNDVGQETQEVRAEKLQEASGLLGKSKK